MEIGNYIKSKLSLWSVDLSDDLIVNELLRVGYNLCDEITENTNLDLFFFNIIPEILIMPKSVSEGGFSITYDKDALLAYYSILAKKLNYVNALSNDTIIDITSKW
jgi:hypothetical protein